MKPKEKYIALLRGVNVGGHHKVPMPDLKKVLQSLGLENIETLLNSGNIIFEFSNESTAKLEKMISIQLKESFGFLIPVVITKSEVIKELLNNNPFRAVKLTKDIRLYASFLRTEVDIKLNIPWKSSDNSYVITEKRDNIILSVLDLSISKTPKAMEILEKQYGKDITTRNWNTIERIGKKLNVCS